MSRLLCRSHRSWTTSPSSLRAIRKAPVAFPSSPISKIRGLAGSFEKTGSVISNTARSLQARPITTLSHATHGNTPSILSKLGRYSRFQNGKLYVGVAATGALIFFMLNGEEEVLASHEMSAFAVDTSKDGQSAASPLPYVIPSSNEERLTITYLLQTYILEPISTFFRFLHLALLFGPVILTSPMLLVGTSNSSRGRPPGQGGSPEDVERWGAVWWHGFLVAQMERAGPTFIKVSPLDRCRRHTI